LVFAVGAAHDATLSDVIALSGEADVNVGPMI